MESDERKKIDIKQYTLPPVSKGYLLRIVIYIVLLTLLSCFAFYFYNLKSEPKPLKSPTDVKEIRGITLSDSL